MICTSDCILCYNLSSFLFNLRMLLRGLTMTLLLTESNAACMATKIVLLFLSLLLSWYLQLTLKYRARSLPWICFRFIYVTVFFGGKQAWNTSGSLRGRRFSNIIRRLFWISTWHRRDAVCTRHGLAMCASGTCIYSHLRTTHVMYECFLYSRSRYRVHECWQHSRESATYESTIRVRRITRCLRVLLAFASVTRDCHWKQTSTKQ